MIKVYCDNCEEEVTRDENQVSLQLSFKNKGDLLDMDLCPKCAKKIIRVLKSDSVEILRSDN